MLSQEKTINKSNPKITDLVRKYNASRKTAHTDLFCHAPFSSMNFQQNGEVLVCCYNRDYVIGKFPEQSLKEIWFGERATELRKAFNKNQLDEGCYLCVNQLESKNFEGLHAKNYDDFSSENNYPDNFTAFPKVIEFEISNQCNLECTMCTGYYSSSIRKNREKLPPSKFYYQHDFVEQLKDFIPHLKKAKFLGGEPFLIKEYIDLWELLGELNPDVEISITTNGTILNDRVKHAIEQLKVWIVVSIDSIREESYNKIRINANFKRVMANVDYFIAYSARKKTGISFAVCPIIDNWHEMAEMTAYCNKRKIKLFFNTVLRPIDKSLLYQPPEKLNFIISQLKKDYYTNGLFLNYASKNTKQYNALINQIQKWGGNYESSKIQRYKEDLEGELNYIDKAIIPKHIDENIDEECFQALLTIMPSVKRLYTANSEEIKTLYFFVREAHEQYEQLRNHFGNKMFVFCFFYAANQYVSILNPQHAQQIDTVSRILDKLSKTLDKQNLWHVQAKNLFDANPIHLVNSISSHLSMKEEYFEKELIQRLEESNL